MAVIMNLLLYAIIACCVYVFFTKNNSKTRKNIVNKVNSVKDDFSTSLNTSDSTSNKTITDFVESLNGLMGKKKKYNALDTYQKQREEIKPEKKKKTTVDEKYVFTPTQNKEKELIKKNIKETSPKTKEVIKETIKAHSHEKQDSHKLPPYADSIWFSMSEPVAAEEAIAAEPAIEADLY